MTSIVPPLPQPEVTFEGGSGMSAGGQGQPGGTVHLVSAGGLTIGPDFQAPAAPPSAAAGADAMVVGSGGLDADIDAPGSVSVPHMVASGGGDGVRHITSGGDLFVDGTIRTADLGGARQGLLLSAPSGTVYVTGTVDTSGASGNGQAGGALTITARRLVVTGSLISAGGDGPAAGAAGAISVTTTDGAFLVGTVDASGGNANVAGVATAGNGGNVTVAAGGDVVFAGTTAARGGAAASTAGVDATAGDAGKVTIDCTGNLALTGTLDDRGGAASVSGGPGVAQGGAAGAFKVGESKRPQSFGITVPLLVKGGNGAAGAGSGGTALLEPHGGDLHVSGTLDVSGGDSAAKPGSGGSITANPGPETATAGLDIGGQMVTNGGAITSGGSGDGGPGGVIKFMAASAGNMTIEPTGQVQVDGGVSGGAGTAGGGGLMYLFTIHGNASIHGKLLARGGAAPDAGGTGGGGGLVYVFTGAGHDRMSGTLIIETDGSIDASGGTGTIGGSARNNGTGGVALFPVHQDDEYSIEQIAVLINSDGVHGSDHGWIDNRGLITARGGATNGAGGDVVFHGKQQDGNETPLPGNVDNAGDGSGAHGDFAGE
jgi:adhesin HecA-like repeat protein